MQDRSTTLRLIARCAVMSSAAAGLLMAVTREQVASPPRTGEFTLNPQVARRRALTPDLEELQARLRAVCDRLAPALPWAIVPAMAMFFGFWYGRVLIGLPLFGDAANHARISRSILDNGLWNTVSGYPPLYHLAGAGLMWLAGANGFISLTIIGVVATGVAVYFFAREASGSNWVALVASLIAFVNPKLPFYAGRLYMEVPLTAAVVVAMTLLHRYLRLRRMRDLWLAAIAVGITCIIKQQGLFVFLPAAAFLWMQAAWTAASRHGGARRQLLGAMGFTVVVVAIISPAYFWMAHSTGDVLPETEFTAALNRGAASLAGYHAPEISQSDQDWNTFLDVFYTHEGYLERGAGKAEQRHVWPQDLVTPSGFFSVNSLYWRDIALVGALMPWGPTIVIEVLLVAGLVIWLASPRSRAFTLFFLLFLAMNYASFVRENDQWRYYLYLPYLMSFAIPLGVHRLCRPMGLAALTLAMMTLTVFTVAYAASYLPERTQAAEVYQGRQAYEPSIGGMASVEDASAFLKAHLSPGGLFYAVPNTEFQYYANRIGVFDYRIYFLGTNELARYFEDHRITYVVVSDSTVKQDSQWRHVVSIPRSFQLKVSAMYPLEYRTDAGDIAIYRVLPADMVPPLPDLDFTEPTASIAAPADDDKVSGSIVVEGHGSDDHQLQQMLFYIDGTFQYGVKGQGPSFRWTWDTSSVEDGRHTVWIKAVDEAGNFSVRHITVDVRN